MLDHPIFAIAGEAADQLGIEAYVVGGMFMDQCLGRQRANFDIDFVCVGSGIGGLSAQHPLSPRIYRFNF